MASETPATAVRITKIAEANGWTVGHADDLDEGCKRIHIIHATRGTDQFDIVWYVRGDRRWAPSTVSARIGRTTETLTLKRLTEVIQEEATEDQTPLPSRPAHIGRCDAAEQAHGQAPAAAIGVRLYYVYDGTPAETAGICAQCAAVRAHRPVADFPAWALTVEDRQAVVDTLAEHIQDARRYAAWEWASDVTNNSDQEDPYDVDPDFDEWYAHTDHINPATAYARWREEQGRPLTADEYPVIGLTAPAEPRTEEPADDIDIPFTVPTTTRVAAAWAKGLCMYARVAAGMWEYTVRGELYSITHEGPYNYTTRHATPSGMVVIPNGGGWASMHAAACAARTHATRAVTGS
ncbi:hypothetical protein ACFVVA_36960 [Kitasatospora sp. NPDC058048]|uniref:hypothetical protein n=1 Tax=Kitasatospora sp. NPDC058048 TaxID=3346313 RepID=UPI0036D93A65